MGLFLLLGRMFSMSGAFLWGSWGSKDLFSFKTNMLPEFRADVKTENDSRSKVPVAGFDS